jgi:hypothetical protein
MTTGDWCNAFVCPAFPATYLWGKWWSCTTDCHFEIQTHRAPQWNHRIQEIHCRLGSGKLGDGYYPGGRLEILVWNGKRRIFPGAGLCGMPTGVFVTRSTTWIIWDNLYRVNSRYSYPTGGKHKARISGCSDMKEARKRSYGHTQWLKAHDRRRLIITTGEWCWFGYEISRDITWDLRSQDKDTIGSRHSWRIAFIILDFLHHCFAALCGAYRVWGAISINSVLISFRLKSCDDGWYVVLIFTCYSVPYRTGSMASVAIKPNISEVSMEESSF